MSRTDEPALEAWVGTTLERMNDSGAAHWGLQTLKAEASFRQFYRVTGTEAALVLMRSPPALERNEAFVAIAAALTDAGVRAPEVLAHDREHGWLLLSDLGDRHFIDAYRAGDEHRCLRAALKTLGLIAPLRHPMIEPYTTARLTDELGIFTEWLVRNACDATLPDALFQPVQSWLLDNAADQDSVCVHRDFHCRNLLLVEADPSAEPDTVDTVGVLDFQDALIGPAGYDLASLLDDCYWRFDDATIDATLAQAAELARTTALAGTSADRITRRNIDLLAIQRQLKAIGIFARLYQRDNKASHLRYIVPVLERLVDLCNCYRELKSFAAWLADTLTPQARHWINAAGSEQQRGASDQLA